MIDAKVIEKIETGFQGELKTDIPMSEYTSIRIGGPADLFLIPADQDSLVHAVQVLREEKIPIWILGNGSNVLVKDGGVRGAVLSLKESHGKIEELEAEVGLLRMRVEAGVSLPSFIRSALAAGAEGPETLVGIPACVGGAIAMNAGTRHGEISQWVEEVTVYNERGNFQKIPRKKLKWKYRALDLPPKAIVLSAIFSMQPGNPEKIEALRQEVLEYRKQTQPLELPSFGSVFKNPGDKEKAGALIEDAGLKGVRLRQTMISEKHANWILNLGDATAVDVVALIKMVKEKVREKTGVRLETEVKIVGEE